MPSKLERTIQPGERVVFRTRMGWRQISGRLAIFAPFAAGLGVFWSYFIGDWSHLYIFFLAAVPGLLLALGSEALVTDMRVLHRAGLLRKRVTEIPLEQIQRVERVTGFVTLRDRAGREINLDRVPNSEGLAEAIATQTGVAAPEVVHGRARYWGYFGVFFMIACGLTMMFLYYLVWEYFIEISFDQAIDYVLLLVYVLSLMIALVVGFTVGLVLLMPVMRLSLSVEEVRAMFNPQERVDYGPKWMAFSALVPFWFARRFASLLFGERI